MKKLHKRAKSILELLQKEPDLSVLEVMRRVGITSPGVYYHHYRTLEKQGFIKKRPSKSWKDLYLKYWAVRGKYDSSFLNYLNEHFEVPNPKKL